MLARAILLIAIAMLPAVARAQTAGAPLVLEAKIPLGEVSGRIDHLAIDVKRQRLFVAELGNNSLGVVDLAAGKVLRRIGGLSEPQGVAYVPFADSVFVANAGDGSVRVLRGGDLRPIGRIDLGDDADNVRVDTPRNLVLVGYGKGALAVIDPGNQSKTADIRLKAHPEGFQIDETGTRGLCQCAGRARHRGGRPCSGVDPIVADARGGIEFSDGDRWRGAPGSRRLSQPAHPDGAVQPGRTVVAKAETCGDADDVFVDAKRRRVYVSCGEGRGRRARAGRDRLSAACARADGIGSAHLAVRSRARPAVCGGAGAIARARSDLGISSGP